eukprot:1158374-Pelagomonas_calceolata.AAC.6
MTLVRNLIYQAICCNTIFYDTQLEPAPSNQHLSKGHPVVLTPASPGAINYQRLRKESSCVPHTCMPHYHQMSANRPATSCS